MHVSETPYTNTFHVPVTGLTYWQLPCELNEVIVNIDATIFYIITPTDLAVGTFQGQTYTNIVIDVSTLPACFSLSFTCANGTEYFGPWLQKIEPHCKTQHQKLESVYDCFDHFGQFHGLLNNVNTGNPDLYYRICIYVEARGFNETTTDMQYRGSCHFELSTSVEKRFNLEFSVGLPEFYFDEFINYLGGKTRTIDGIRRDPEGATYKPEGKTCLYFPNTVFQTSKRTVQQACVEVCEADPTCEDINAAIVAAAFAVVATQNGNDTIYSHESTGVYDAALLDGIPVTIESNGQNILTFPLSQSYELFTQPSTTGAQATVNFTYGDCEYCAGAKLSENFGTFPIDKPCEVECPIPDRNAQIEGNPAILVSSSQAVFIGSRIEFAESINGVFLPSQDLQGIDLGTLNAVAVAESWGDFVPYSEVVINTDQGQQTIKGSIAIDGNRAYFRELILPADYVSFVGYFISWERCECINVLTIEGETQGTGSGVNCGNTQGEIWYNIEGGATIYEVSPPNPEDYNETIVCYDPLVTVNVEVFDHSATGGTCSGTDGDYFIRQKCRAPN